MACVKELGGLESTPQTNFVEKAGGVEKTVGGFNPPTPPTTKSLLDVLVFINYHHRHLLVHNQVQAAKTVSNGICLVKPPRTSSAEEFH